MVKKVLLWTAAAICLVAVVVGGAWCSAQGDASPCTEVRIELADSLERQFVDIDELAGYLKRRGCYPMGKVMDEVDCHAIEQCLLTHEMVREVSCYKSPFAGVCIDVSQRVPVLSVVSNDGCYYVDSDRRVMPATKKLDAPLPVLRGAVSKRAATEEYYDFVEWLSDHSYWGERIKSVHVSNPHYVVLRQQDNATKIVLGALSDYEAKLDKLQKLYTRGLAKIDCPEYKEYDLRYAGQVVGRE